MFQMRPASVACASALSGVPQLPTRLPFPIKVRTDGDRTLIITHAAEQTQTVTRQSSIITVAPVQGKEKSPDLDDGGSVLPPSDDVDGGWAGGFFFFRFLAFIGLLTDSEGDNDFMDRSRRR